MKSSSKISSSVEIPIKMIVPPSSEHDIRKIGIEQLTESIRAVGLINPITVRAVGKGKCDIVAGRRRYWACLAAGIDNINCIELDDKQNAQADIIEVTENMHRVQLTPMQEAEAIQKLRDLKHSDESIAADLGMTRQFVARRAKLLDLSPEWRNALTGKKKSYHWSGADCQIKFWPVACLELIARYPRDRQKQLFEEFESNDSVPDIDSLKLTLSSDDQRLLTAPWKLDDESLYPKAGACLNCPKRSSCQPLLFDDENKSRKVTMADKCLDPECWGEKLKLHTDTALNAAKAKYPDAILVKSGYSRDSDSKALAKYQYEAVSKSTKGARQAIFVDGNEVGKTLWIKPEREAAKKTAPKTNKPLTDKDRAQRLRDRRNKWIVDTVRNRLSKENKDWPVPNLKSIAVAVTIFGLNIHRIHRSFNEHPIERDLKMFSDKLKSASDKELGEAFWRNFRQDMSGELLGVNTGIMASGVVPAMTPLFYMMGTTFEALWAESAEEIPDRHNYLGENSKIETVVKKTTKDIVRPRDNQNTKKTSMPKPKLIQDRRANENGVYTQESAEGYYYLHIFPIPKYSNLNIIMSIDVAKGSDGLYRFGKHYQRHIPFGRGIGNLPSVSGKGFPSLPSAQIAGATELLAVLLEDEKDLQKDSPGVERSGHFRKVQALLEDFISQSKSLGSS